MMFAFRNWLHKLAGRLGYRFVRKPRLKRSHYGPRIDTLEWRIAPAQVIWTGSGDWSVAANWTDQSDGTHHVPGIGDDAVINNATVTVTGDLAINGTVTLNGGALRFSANLGQTQ